MPCKRRQKSLIFSLMFGFNEIINELLRRQKYKKKRYDSFLFEFFRNLLNKTDFVMPIIYVFLRRNYEMCIMNCEK